MDADGICTSVDACGLDVENDADGDGICGDVDSCPYDAENDADKDSICWVSGCPSPITAARRLLTGGLGTTTTIAGTAPAPEPTSGTGTKGPSTTALDCSKMIDATTSKISCKVSRSQPSMRMLGVPRLPIASLCACLNALLLDGWLRTIRVCNATLVPYAYLLLVLLVDVS